MFIKFSCSLLGIQQEVRRRAKVVGKQENLNAEHLWKNYSNPMKKVCYWNFEFPGSCDDSKKVLK